MDYILVGLKKCSKFGKWITQFRYNDSYIVV